jgi:hypothetical protein
MKNFLLLCKNALSNYNAGVVAVTAKVVWLAPVDKEESFALL